MSTWVATRYFLKARAIGVALWAAVAGGRSLAKKEEAGTLAVLKKVAEFSVKSCWSIVRKCSLI